MKSGRLVFCVGCGWVDGSGQGTQAEEQRWGGSVKPLVCNAEDTAIAHSAEIVPATLCDHALKRDAVAGAAPGEDQEIGIGGRNCFGCGLLCGLANKLPTGGVNQFCNPWLRMDERLAPFFAIHART